MVTYYITSDKKEVVFMLSFFPFFREQVQKYDIFIGNIQADEDVSNVSNVSITCLLFI